VQPIHLLVFESGRFVTDLQGNERDGLFVQGTASNLQPATVMGQLRKRVPSLRV